MYSLYVEKYHKEEVEIVYADTNQIDKDQFSQNQQTFSDEEIRKQVKDTENDGRGFLKL